MGNISMMDGAAIPHLYITAADSDFNMIGGHLISAIVSATAEIFIEVYDERFGRKPDPKLGMRNLVLREDKTSI
jgi:predicted DNA-binding protein with PD1-like motif